MDPASPQNSAGAQAATAELFRGRFIVLDGPDGAGKSTQLRLLGQWLGEMGVATAVTRDPGGTAVGDRVRQILLDPAMGEISGPCETMLYMASRAQLLAEVVRPALTAGRCVLCDRFVSATVAYQGAAGVPAEDVLAVARVAVGDTWPELTVILDLDARQGLGRVGGTLDRMEAKGLDFHARVRDGFLAQARQRPDRFAVIDAAGTVAEVQQRLRQTLLARLRR